MTILVSSTRRKANLVRSYLLSWVGETRFLLGMEEHHSDEGQGVTGPEYRYEA